MAVVVFVTACPAQAAGYGSTQTNAKGLEEKVAQHTRVASPIVYPGIPNPDAIYSRYLQARENTSTTLAELDKLEGQDTAALEEYVTQLKTQAKELAKTADYKDIPYFERQQAAFNTLLLFDNSIWDFKEKVDIMGAAWQISIGAAIFTGWLSAQCWNVGAKITEQAVKKGSRHVAKGLRDTSAWLGKLSGWLMAAYFIIEFFTDSYTPAIAPSATEDEVVDMFMQKPFAYLADWEENNGAVEQALMYRKGPKAAQVLADAVDIEYYTSRHMTAQDLKDKLYVGSKYWYDLSTEDRVAHLSQFAERVRAQAQAQEAQYVDNHTTVHRYRTAER